MSGTYSERWVGCLGESSLTINNSLEDVITEYSNLIYRLALSQMKNKSDADDVFQEVFFRYVRKQPQFKSKDHQKAWFIRVTVNCCKSMHTSVWKKRMVPLDESMPYLDEEQRDFMQELQKLPRKYLAVVHLYYYEDMRMDEIGNALGISLSAVKMRLVRAREMLRGILKEEDYV